MSFLIIVILAEQFIVRKKKMSTKSINKKNLQKVSTKSVYNMSPHNKSTKVVVKKILKKLPYSVYEKCPRQVPQKWWWGGWGLTNALKGLGIYYLMSGPMRPHKILHPMYIQLLKKPFPTYLRKRRRKKYKTNHASGRSAQ